MWDIECCWCIEYFSLHKYITDTDYKSGGQEHGSSRSSWQVSMSSPTEQQRQSVIQEILQTEATYLRELLLVDEVS